MRSRASILPLVVLALTTAREPAWSACSLRLSSSSSRSPMGCVGHGGRTVAATAGTVPMA